MNGIHLELKLPYRINNSVRSSTPIEVDHLMKTQNQPYESPNHAVKNLNVTLFKA